MSRSELRRLPRLLLLPLGDFFAGGVIGTISLPSVGMFWFAEDMTSGTTRVKDPLPMDITERLLFRK